MEELYNNRPQLPPSPKPCIIHIKLYVLSGRRRKTGVTYKYSLK